MTTRNDILDKETFTPKTRDPSEKIDQVLKMVERLVALSEGERKLCGRNVEDEGPCVLDLFHDLDCVTAGGGRRLTLPRIDTEFLA